MTQLFAFGDKHAAFERNGNMSLFEKFELAREVSEICDSVVPLIKVVIVEGGCKRGSAAASDHAVQAAVRAAAADRCKRGYDSSGPPSRACGRPEDTACCRNPFGAIMDDDVDCCRRGRKNGVGRRKTAVAGKCIELEVYSRSVNYFHEPGAAVPVRLC